MPERLTYNDALTVLGRTKSRLVSLLDGAVTAGLTVWAAAALAGGKDSGAPLSLIELKSEIVHHAHEIVRKAAEWRSGLSRFDRSQRLAAAHSIVVVSSFFTALEKADLPIPLEQMRLTAAEKAALATGKGLPDGYVKIIELLAYEPIAIPEPHRRYGEVRMQLASYYGEMSARVVAFVSGLALWDELDSRRRQELATAIRDVPNQALETYDDAYRNLAADNREFEVWASLTEAHSLGEGLSGITSLLTDMVTRRPGHRPRAHLVKSYQAALREPVAGAIQAPDGLVLPSLGEAYINPQCRIAQITPGDTPAVTEWWAGREIAPDTGTFLAGYLTSLRAVQTPLVVLGEPGSGKSKLAKVLAARLPDQDFLPVLVELRDVAAQSMIQEQIEQAIYQDAGERANWYDLLETAEGALPVVLLDGFDEVVQATSLNRYDYLEQVRDFQRKQEQIGHPVAVIVTSRTVVADQVRFPSGTLVARLEPFNDTQISSWLNIWARHNTALLASRGLRPLPIEIALSHGELAQQPLLLLMLAIFDATGNALQGAGAPIGRAELYERLLTDFAWREITKSKHNRSLPTAKQWELAEQEVQRLAVVALAMFARGQQKAIEAELNRDLPILFPDSDAREPMDQAAVSPAQQATGRFFFIHRSEALSQGSRARSYEFLHATFGEYLIARLTVSALRDLAMIQEVIRRGRTATTARLDDGFLYAVLSFSCLAIRTAVIDFLRELLKSIPDDVRTQFLELLPELLTSSLFPRPSRSLEDYEPVRHPIPRRLAAYSANLMLLLVLLDNEIDASQLFGRADAAETWRQYGHLWRGALTAAEWRGIVTTIRARVRRHGPHADVRLTLEDGSPVSPYDSLIITADESGKEIGHYDILVAQDGEVSYDAKFPASSTAGRVFRDFAFLPSWHTGLFLLQSVPVARALQGEARWPSGKGIVPGYLLSHLDYSRAESVEERVRFYGYCLKAMTDQQLHEQLMLRLKEDAPTFQPETIIGLLRGIRAVPTDSYVTIVNELWRRTDSEAIRSKITSLIGEICRIHKAVPEGLVPYLTAAGSYALK